MRRRRAENVAKSVHYLWAMHELLGKMSSTAQTGCDGDHLTGRTYMQAGKILTHITFCFFLRLIFISTRT